MKYLQQTDYAPFDNDLQTYLAKGLAIAGLNLNISEDAMQHFSWLHNNQFLGNDEALAAVVTEASFAAACTAKKGENTISTEFIDLFGTKNFDTTKPMIDGLSYGQFCNQPNAFGYRWQRTRLIINTPILTSIIDRVGIYNWNETLALYTRSNPHASDVKEVAEYFMRFTNGKTQSSTDGRMIRCESDNMLLQLTAAECILENAKIVPAVLVRRFGKDNIFEKTPFWEYREMTPHACLDISRGC